LIAWVPLTLDSHVGLPSFYVGASHISSERAAHRPNIGSQIPAMAPHPLDPLSVAELQAAAAACRARNDGDAAPLRFNVITLQASHGFPATLAAMSSRLQLSCDA